MPKPAASARSIAARATVRLIATITGLALAVAVAAGCAALDGSDADTAAAGSAIGSDTVPADELAAVDERGADEQDAVAGSSDGVTADTDDGDGVDELDGSTAVEPAPESSDPDPELSPDPAIDYPAGTCYRPPVADGEPSGGAEATAEPVDCLRPHTIEVYASVDLPGGPGAPFQGLDAAIDACGAEFDELTGVDLSLATVIDRSVLRPSEATWADGERTVTCYVVFPDPTTERLADLDPVRSFGRVSLFGLGAGDCLASFDETDTWFELVDCGQPHEAEVFVAQRFPDETYPGDLVLTNATDDLCFGQAFEDFVGRDYASSTIRSISSVPTAETWPLGDRTVNCILVDGQVRSESFRGSGL